MKRDALIGALIVGAFLWVATYYWGAADNGKPGQEGLPPQATGQTAGKEKAAAANKSGQKEGKVHGKRQRVQERNYTASRRSTDTREGTRTEAGSLVRGKTDNEGPADAVTKHTARYSEDEEAGVRTRLPARGYTSDGVSMGTFEITAYTAGYESTGKRPGDKYYGITYSGLPVEEGVTIAADLTLLPLGSVVYIEGVGERVVMDKGGAIKGKILDLYIPELDDALRWGRRHREVWLIKKGDGEL